MKNKILGSILVSIPFVAMIGVTIGSLGLLQALVIWGSTLLFAALIMTGVYLIMEDYK